MELEDNIETLGEKSIRIHICILFVIIPLSDLNTNPPKPTIYSIQQQDYSFHVFNPQGESLANISYLLTLCFQKAI